MYKNLRIVFTILSAICLAAAIPMGMFFDLVGIIGTLIGAGVFFFLMMLCKQSQESQEKKAERGALLPNTELSSAEKGNGAGQAVSAQSGKTTGAPDAPQTGAKPQGKRTSQKPTKNAPPKYRRTRK